jgi:magnesium-transporting ATPase (P-type)
VDSKANHNYAAGTVGSHALTVDEVLKLLGTSIGEGLAAGEASSRLSKYGSNRLPEGKRRGPFIRLIVQLDNILVYVLVGASFVKLMLGLHGRSGAHRGVGPG